MAQAEVADFRGEPASAQARNIARWAADQGDAGGRPFAVVDKRAARIFVFTADGRLAGSAPALLGLAPGDDRVPGSEPRARPLAPHERTTPAGRFDAEPGRNDKGEAIVWFDYAAALAIHRLRPAHPSERRPQRLASATVADNRISLGCVVVSPAFYDGVVGPTLGRERSVVYVLPESRALEDVFGIAAGMEL